MNSETKKKSKSKKFCKVDIQSSENTIINIKKQVDGGETQLLPGFNSSELYQQEYVDSFSHCENCWNCHHKIDVNNCIPLKKCNNVFYVYGNFCSEECSARYIQDTYKGDKDLWEKMALLNLYHNICSMTKGRTISIAPPKLRLSCFGGDLSIEEYRASFKKNNLSEIYLPPIIPVKHEILVNERSNESTSNKHSFKLYRKTPMNSSNNIYNSMSLITKEDTDEIISSS